MAKKEMRNGELCVYCDEDGKWYPKYKLSNGLRQELDEKYFIYVLEGDTVDESRQRDAELEEDDELQLSPYYGLARERYLRENAPLTYAEMEFYSNLQPHLYDIERQAQAMEDKLVEQYKAAEGITEDLKRTNQMEWVGLMNNIILRVRAIVQNELIFV